MQNLLGQFEPFALIVPLCTLAGVLVVDPSGSGTFTDIQPACNAAAERDTILVKSGTYPAFDVADKWLTIAADAGAGVDVAGARIHDLGLGKVVTLIGLNLHGITSGPPAAARGVDAHTCQGAIRVVGCTLHGDDGQPYPSPQADGGDALRLDGCSDVEVSRSHLFGGLGAYGYVGGIDSPGRGGAGVRAIASSVVMYDCDAHGGNGETGNPWDGGVGGHGCHSLGSTLLASRSAFTGGNGGNHGMSGNAYGGAGGDGLFLEGQIDLARLLTVTSAAGHGGYTQPPLSFEYPEPDGYPYHGSPAQFVTLPAVGRSMSIATDPIRENTSASIVVSGLPNDRIALFLSSATSSTFVPKWFGERMFPLSPFTSAVKVPFLPLTPTQTFTLHFPDLGPGVHARTFVLQPLFAGTNGQRVLGTPVSLLVLDSAY